MIWRWDQGRTTYFSFDKIRLISKVLLEFNGADTKQVESAFRDKLIETTGLPFAPAHYTIKRNYKRVFECAMIGTFMKNRVIVSDIGRALATDDSRFQDVDSYLREVVRRFRYPYPAFNNYSDVKVTCYPFMTLLKLLLSLSIASGSDSSISLEDIGNYLIANNTTGLEDLSFYLNLKPQPFSFDSYSSNDQRRQVREMMPFISQYSFLEYANGTIRFKINSVKSCQKMFAELQPYSNEISAHDLVNDFLQLTTVSSQMSAPIEKAGEDYDMSEEYVVKEGKQVFKQHFAYERSPQLRELYIKSHPEPVCDMCKRNMKQVYPWANYLLEIHHLLPLSSFDEVSESHISSLDDIVGLCPACHRAVHLFYKVYLLSYEQEDFTSAEEAREAYYAAKAEVNFDV